jgi:hypothetical protein
LIAGQLITDLRHKSTVSAVRGNPFDRCFTEESTLWRIALEERFAVKTRTGLENL